MKEVSWQNCKGNTRCSLRGVNLSHAHFNEMEGVYIIWQGGGPVIRVGQGNIKDRITEHRHDEEINQYAKLYVTWAQVPPYERDGVERFLANVLNPKVGNTFPDTEPIKVNLPWPWKI